jgi:hypothetical protein
LALWAAVAVPSCGFLYWFSGWYPVSQFWVWVFFFLASAVLGGLVVAGVAPAAFGEPLTFRATIRRAWGGNGWLLLRGLLMRLLIAAASLMLIVPGVYLAIRDGFYVEQKVLKNLAHHLHDRRASELLKGEIGDLFGRALLIVAYCALLWVVMVLTTDFASRHLLGLPLLWERLALDRAYLGGEWYEVIGPWLVAVFKFFWSDRVVLVLLLATALLAYLPGRIAWFVCYIDIRVQRDCWDMELEILREAQRVEAQ